MTAPVNDNYASATEIIGTNGSTTGTTIGSTTGYMENGAKGVWFKWVATVTGTCKITVDAALPDGTLVFSNIDVYRGGEDQAFTAYDVASNYEGPTTATPGRSVVVFDATVGVEYHIGILHARSVGASLVQANFTLTWLQASPTQDADGNTTSRIVLPGDTPIADGIAYVPVSGEVWVLTYEDKIARIDPDTGLFKSWVTAPDGSQIVEPMVYDAISMRVWVPATGTNAMLAFDGVTGNLVRTLSGDWSAMYGVSPYDGSLVMPLDDGIKIYATGSNTPQSYFYASGKVGTPYQFAFRKNGDILFWVHTWASDAFTVYSFNRTSHAFTLLQTVTYDRNIDIGNGLAQFVYDSDRDSLWFAGAFGGANDYGVMQELDLATNTFGPEIDAQPSYWKVGGIPLLYSSADKVLWMYSQQTQNISAYSTVDGSVFQQTPVDNFVIKSLALVQNAIWSVDEGYGNLFRTSIKLPALGVINDRDVWLETFANRFASPTAQNNSDINQSQATGTGIVIAAAKSLTLSATSQTFRVGGAVVEPSWITLTPALRNLTGTPTYSVLSGSATLNVAGGKCQVTFGNMGSSRVTIRATLTEGGVTYRDQVTLVKLDTGGTAITPLLTNEMQPMLADSYGNVLNYMGASGTFRVWEGAMEITNDCTFSVATNANNLLVEISNIGQYTVYGIPAAIDNATVVFRATYHGTTYDQTFYLDKIKSPVGAAYDPATQSVGGKRLPVTVSIVSTLVTWTDTLANTAVAPLGGQVRNDIVTEYNNVPNPPWKETRFWDGTKWDTLDAKIDGNLLVTGSVSADKLSANTVDAFTGTFSDLITDQITAARAEIDTLIADQIDAVNGNFDTLTVGGTQILPNSINTGHVVDNAISVPLLTDGFNGTNIGADWDSATMTGAYAGAATALVTVTIQGSAGPVAATAEIQVYLDGARQQARAFNLPPQTIVGNTMQVQIAVPAGSHSWFIRFHRQGSNDWTLWSFSVSVLGVMK